MTQKNEHPYDTRRREETRQEEERQCQERQQRMNEDVLMATTIAMLASTTCM